jgi:hypothetical protein
MQLEFNFGTSIIGSSSGSSCISKYPILVRSNQRLNPLKWTHVAYTIKNNCEVNIYINGHIDNRFKVDGCSITEGGMDRVINTNNFPFYIGPSPANLNYELGYSRIYIAGAGFLNKDTSDEDIVKLITSSDILADFHKISDSKKSDDLTYSSPPVVTIISKPVMCRNNHELIVENYDRGWNCDELNCRKFYNSSSNGVIVRYRCRHCDFNYCGSCYESKVTTTTKTEPSIKCSSDELAILINKTILSTLRLAPYNHKNTIIVISSIIRISQAIVKDQDSSVLNSLISFKVIASLLKLSSQSNSSIIRLVSTKAITVLLKLNPSFSSLSFFDQILTPIVPLIDNDFISSAINQIGKIMYDPFKNSSIVTATTNNNHLEIRNKEGNIKETITLESKCYCKLEQQSFLLVFQIKEILLAYIASQTEFIQKSFDLKIKSILSEIDVLFNTSDNTQLYPIIGLLILLGGIDIGIFPGSIVTYSIEDSTLPESYVVLRYLQSTKNPSKAETRNATSTPTSAPIQNSGGSSGFGGFPRDISDSNPFPPHEMGCGEQLVSKRSIEIAPLRSMSTEIYTTCYEENISNSSIILPDILQNGILNNFDAFIELISLHLTEENKLLSSCRSKILKSLALQVSDNFINNFNINSNVDSSATSLDISKLFPKILPILLKELHIVQFQKYNEDKIGKYSVEGSDYDNIDSISFLWSNICNKAFSIFKNGKVKNLPLSTINTQTPSGFVSGVPSQPPTKAPTPSCFGASSTQPPITNFESLNNDLDKSSSEIREESIVEDKNNSNLVNSVVKFTNKLLIENNIKKVDNFKDGNVVDKTNIFPQSFMNLFITPKKCEKHGILDVLPTNLSQGATNIFQINKKIRKFSLINELNQNEDVNIYLSNLLKSRLKSQIYNFVNLLMINWPSDIKIDNSLISPLYITLRISTLSNLNVLSPIQGIVQTEEDKDKDEYGLSNSFKIFCNRYSDEIDTELLENSINPMENIFNKIPILSLLLNIISANMLSTKNDNLKNVFSEINPPKIIPLKYINVCGRLNVRKESNLNSQVVKVIEPNEVVLIYPNNEIILADKSVRVCLFDDSGWTSLATQNGQTWLVLFDDNITCLKNHTLKPLKINLCGSCDKCKTVRVGEINVFDCRLCNYWLCNRCYEQAVKTSTDASKRSSSPASGAQETGFGVHQATGFGAPQAPRFGTPGFGAPPQTTGFGVPQTTGFGVPHTTGFGAPQATGFGAPPQTTGFGVPQATGFGAPHQTTGFGVPQATGFAAPQATGFAAPQATGFGAPQATGFEAKPTSKATNPLGGFNVHNSSPSTSTNIDSSGFGTLQTPPATPTSPPIEVSPLSLDGNLKVSTSPAQFKTQAIARAKEKRNSPEKSFEKKIDIDINDIKINQEDSFVSNVDKVEEIIIEPVVDILEELEKFPSIIQVLLTPSHYIAITSLNILLKLLMDRKIPLMYLSEVLENIILTSIEIFSK